MPATAIAPTRRYFRPGITKVIWVSGEEGLADYTSPTRTEIDDGVDLSAEVFEINGFQVESEAVDTPDFGARFVGNIPGNITVPDSNLVTYADRESADIRSELSRDDEGYLIFMDEGDIEDNLMDIFPARVRSMPKLRPRDDPARIQTDFSVDRIPAENVSIPPHAA